MARTWGDAIDLTKSDDEGEKPIHSLPPSRPKQTPVPLPANVRHLYPDTPAPAPNRPKQTPIPLPNNIRHLYGSTASNRSASTSSPKPSPPINPFKRTSAVNIRNPSAIRPASNDHRNGIAPSRGPAINMANGDNVEIISAKNKPAKKRKVSAPGTQETAPTPLYPPHPHTNNKHTNHGTSFRNGESGVQPVRNDEPRPRASNGNPAPNSTKGPVKQVPQHLLGNKTPSTSFINAALKSKRTTISVVEDMLPSKPTAFHIGSMPMDEEEKEVYRLPNSLVASITTASPKECTRRKSSLADSDMQLNDTNQTLTAFPFRKSPKKKLTNPTLRNPDMQSSPRLSPVSLPRAPDVSVSEGRDSVVLSSTVRDQPAAVSPPQIAQNPGPSQLQAGRFTEEEDHLLIFLKEVKRFRWTEIMEHFPERKFGGVQTRYSHKLNKRDRSLDPPQLNLPARYAAESVVDWTVVHGHNPTPAKNPATIELIQEAEEFAPPTRKRVRLQPQDSLSRDDSSANESGPPKARPRRNAPQVNYAWPRRNRGTLPDEDSVIEYSVVPDERGMSTHLASSEAPDEAPLGPDVFIPVDKPMSMDLEQGDAGLAVSLHQAARGVTSDKKLPYLCHSQRAVIRNYSIDGEWEQFTGRDWQGSIVHVDFNNEEQDIVERAALELLESTQVRLRDNGRKRFRKLLKNLSDRKILQLAYIIRPKLFTRDQESISAFLVDAKDGKVAYNPQIKRIGAVRPSRRFSSAPKSSTSSLIRQRELGLQSRRGWRSSSKPLSYQMVNNVQDTLGRAYSFTGASSDVHTVAWSPDGQSFAAGAVCVTDPDSMQYNRSNNLLYGDLSNGTIQELGEHSIARPRTVTGANSTHAMYSSQDPVLYTTISSVAFSPQGDYMFSAGYDEYACIWRTSRDGSQPEHVKSLKHRAAVDIMTVGPHGKIATAAKRWTSNAVKVITIMDDTVDFTFNKQSYTSSKALKQPDMNILPTALAFEPNDGRFLLAGFGANSKASENRLDMNGDICLWDVDTQDQLTVHGSGKNVFDIAFNPRQRYQPLFAVGCVAPAQVNRGTRSIIRLYDTRGYDAKFSMMVEMECPALDMNDVIWCPHDEHMIAAGCTSGSTYIWDIRRPDNILYILSHGKSLMPLDDFTDREVTDTGVRFLSWGQNATRLYSGSSDGVVKVWDVVGSTQDVFIKDLMTADSGIMSGAFSPDKTKLIVGEVNGSINILEVGRNDCTARDAERLQYLAYQDSANDDNDSIASNETPGQVDSGKAITYESLMTGQMVIRPMGGLPIYQSVQGPNYDGPFDNSVDAPFLRQQALEFQMTLATTPGPQCPLESCLINDFSKVTFEETGDSGRSADRIPDELRKQWKNTGAFHTTIPGKAKCTDCGRPARPVDSTANIHASALCERCSFSCFRCGGINKVQPEMDTLICETCERIWEIGALGYECVKETRTSLRVDVPILFSEQKKDFDMKERFKNTYVKNASADGNSSFGDEMNALTDYYLGMAIDSPESPPL